MPHMILRRWWGMPSATASPAAWIRACCRCGCGARTGPAGGSSSDGPGQAALRRPVGIRLETRNTEQLYPDRFVFRSAPEEPTGDG